MVQQGLARWRPTFFAAGGTLLVVGGIALGVPMAKHPAPGITASREVTVQALREEQSALAPPKRRAAADAVAAAPPPTRAPAAADPVPRATTPSPAPEPWRSVEEQRLLTNEDGQPRAVYSADPRRLRESDAPEERSDASALAHDPADPRLDNELEPKIRQLGYDEQRRLDDAP